MNKIDETHYTIDLPTAKPPNNINTVQGPAGDMWKKTQKVKK